MKHLLFIIATLVASCAFALHSPSIPDTLWINGGANDGTQRLYNNNWYTVRNSAGNPIPTNKVSGLGLFEYGVGASTDDTMDSLRTSWFKFDTLDAAFKAKFSINEGNWKTLDSIQFVFHMFNPIDSCGCSHIYACHPNKYAGSATTWGSSNLDWPAWRDLSQQTNDTTAFDSVAIEDISADTTKVVFTLLRQNDLDSIYYYLNTTTVYPFIDIQLLSPQHYTGDSIQATVASQAYYSSVGIIYSEYGVVDKRPMALFYWTEHEPPESAFTDRGKWKGEYITRKKGTWR